MASKDSDKILVFGVAVLTGAEVSFGAALGRAHLDRDGDEDEDTELDSRIVEEFHFGGGLLSKASNSFSEMDEDALIAKYGAVKSSRSSGKREYGEVEGFPSEEGEDPDRKKSKKEIYEEIISKSKFYKAQRKKGDESLVPLLAVGLSL